MDIDLVDELLGMAKDPDQYTRIDMAEMILVAATEIIRLREHVKIRRRKRNRGRKTATNVLAVVQS
jgi:hypothetical protein